MLYQDFIKIRILLMSQGIEITLPRYYDLIDDDIRFTPKRIAQVLGKNEKSIPRIRCWFSEGLSHGKLVSAEPTRHVVLGRDLKEFLFQKDWKKICKQRYGKNELTVMDLINQTKNPV